MLRRAKTSASLLVAITALTLYVSFCVSAAFAQISPGVGGGIGAGYSNGPESASAASTPARYSVTGTVVNAVTGDPIPHALVQVMANAQHSTFTDDNGQFTLEDLPGPIHTAIQVHKPGFLPPEELGANAVLVTTGQTTAPVVVSLVPQSIIAGQVVDEDGEPVQGAMISVKCARVVAGRKSWQPCGVTSTDEDGEFRVAHLQAGSYSIMASVIGRQRPGRPDATEPRKGQAPAFYPPPTDGATPAAMHLSAGAKKQVTLTLRTVPVFNVYGMVTGGAPNQGPGLQLLDRADNAIPANVRLDPTSGTFVLQNVPAGSYRLRATGSDGRGHMMAAEVPVSVNAEVSGVTVALRPAVAIPISVHAELTHDPAENGAGLVQINNVKVRPGTIVANACVHPASGLEHMQCAETQVNGDVPEQEFRGLQPGHYTIDIRPMGMLYASAATYDGDDVLKNGLTVKPGGNDAPLEVTVRDDGATLKCALRADNDAQATVLILSDDQRWSMTQMLGPGTEAAIYAVPPGDYKVYAFDRIDDLEYMNPDALSDYAAKAVALTLLPNETRSLKLDVIKRGMK